MTTNITLRLDKKTVDRLRHLAVDQHTSVSAWVGQLVKQKVEELDGFELQRKRALRAMRDPVSVADASTLEREASHER